KELQRANKMKRINCRRCVHYFVTWQAGKPHGCRAYGFKSQQIPSLVVFQSTGTDCSFFTEKHPAK
ncbi:MAG: hypothetical protein RBR54_08480, partial [Sulfurimonas sp.]|nr:hypothetical protein [Sulfurimonas sp.]